MLTEQQIRKIIAERNSKIDWDTVNGDTTFDDLGIDSLDRFDIVLGMQEASGFEVPDDDVEQLQSIVAIQAYFSDK